MYVTFMVTGDSVADVLIRFVERQPVRNLQVSLRDGALLGHACVEGQVDGNEISGNGFQKGFCEILLYRAVGKNTEAGAIKRSVHVL